MVKVAICDDDILFISKLENHIICWHEKMGIQIKIDTFTDGKKLLSMIKEMDYDIIFLDYIMPSINGADVASKIRDLNENIVLIFCTSYFQLSNIKTGYDVMAWDFLKKPVTYKKIEKILEKICHKKAINKDKKILIKNQEGIFAIQISDIIFIKSINKRTLVKTVQSEIYSSKKLYQYEELLGTMRFYRCHNSYLINLDYVDKLKENDIILITGHSIALSKYRKDSFIQSMANYWSDKI